MRQVTSEAGWQRDERYEGLLMSKHVVLWLSLVVMAACTKESEAPVVASQPNPALKREIAEIKDPTMKMARAVTTGKTGASVDLKYDFSRKPEAGVATEVKLAIIPNVAADRLSYKISGMEGLTLAGTLEGNIDKPESGKVYDHSFSLLPERSGIYYATVTIVMESGEAQMGRTFSVPLLVGNVTSAQKAASPPQKDAAGEPIESMKAEER
jgi:hypothetical protein